MSFDPLNDSKMSTLEEVNEAVVYVITLQGMEKLQCALRRSYHNEEFILTICSYGKFF
jgi:hypothetical protein